MDLQNKSGNILVEAVICLVVLLMGILINLELVRRSQIEIILERSAFIMAREIVLGVSKASVKKKLCFFANKIWNEKQSNTFCREIELDNQVINEGLLARVHWRYPSFMRFKHILNGEIKNKHHFEVTKKCRFFFSQ